MKQGFTVLLLLFACVGVGWGQYSIDVTINGVTENYENGDTVFICPTTDSLYMEAQIDLLSANVLCATTPRFYGTVDGVRLTGYSNPNYTNGFTFTGPFLPTSTYGIQFFCGPISPSSQVAFVELKVLTPELVVSQPVALCQDPVGTTLGSNPDASFSVFGCDNCQDYSWSFDNNYNSGTLSTNDLTVNYSALDAAGSFTTLEVSTITATDPFGCSWVETVDEVVDYGMSPSAMAILPLAIGPLCKPEPNINLVSTAANMNINCSGCQPSYTWDWVFGNGYIENTGTATTYTPDYATVNGGGITFLAAPSTTISLQATDIVGCVWESPSRTISVGAAPFTDFVGPTTPTVLMQGNSPEDLTTYLQPSASAGASYSLSAGSAGLLLGSDYYPVQLGTATLEVSETTAAGCVYNDQMIVEVVDQFNLLNTTTVGQGREVCVGDDLRVLVYNIPGNPQFLSFSTAAGGTATVTIPSASITSAGGGNFNIDMTLSVPNSWVSGPVEILDNSNNVLMSSPQGLIVNNPSLGLAFAKNPICYSDEVAVYGQPAGGVLSAYDLPGAVPNTNLLTNISGTHYIDASAVDLTDTDENHEVEQIRVEYQYQPSYSDGAACPSTVSITKDIDIRDDRLFTAFLPDVVEDQPTYNLGDSISDIYPDPSGTMAAKPIDFSGTHIQPNGATYEFLPQAAGAGFHPLEFSIENSGGCSAVGGAAVHVLAKPSEDALADTICSTTGTFNFSRDINLSHLPFDPSFATVNRADCGQQVSGLRPMAPGTAGGGRQLGQNLYADSSIQLPIGGIWVGDSSYFAYNSNLQQAARLGCADVLAMRQGRERHRITKVAAFANDGGLPPNLAAIQAGTNEITGANVSTNLNGSPEQLALDIDVVKTAIRGNGTWDDNRFYVVVVYQDRYQNHYYEEDGVTVRNTSAIETSFTYSVEEVYLLDSEDFGVQPSFGPVHCYNDGVVQLPLFPAFTTGSSVTVEQLSTGATQTFNSDQLDFNDPFFSSTVDEDYEITYNYSGYLGCAGTVGPNNPKTFRLNAPTSIDLTGLPPRVCENATVILNPSPAVNAAGGVGEFLGAGAVNSPTSSEFNGGAAGVQSGFANTLTYEYTDADGCVSSATTTITVDEAPELSLLQKDPLCRESATGLTNLDANSIYEVACNGPGCAGVLYNWSIAGTLADSATPNAQVSFSLNQLLSSPISAPISNTATSTSLEVRAVNFWGCSEIAPIGATVDIGKAPFDSLSLPDVFLESTSNCEIISPYVNGTGALGSSFDYLVGSNNLGHFNADCYYPTDQGLANIYVVGHDNLGCSYQAEDDVLVIREFDFENNTTPPATTNWEACVGDLVRVTANNVAFTPTAIEILQQDGTFDRRDFSSPGITASFSTITAGLYGGTVSFEILSTDVTGLVRLVDNSGNRYSSPRQLVVNNPDLGLFLGKTPICYDDVIEIYSQPVNGVFTAYEYDAATMSYVPNYAMVANDSLYASAWNIPNASENNGGGDIRLEYNYLPSYSDGTFCPDSITAVQDYFLHDNRLTSAFLPITYIDSTGTYDLGTNIQNIFPEPVSPYLGQVDTAFSGTFVQQNPATGDYEFLTASAGSGSFDLSLEMNFGGCVATTELNLFIQEEAEIPNFPTKICSVTDSIDFLRDNNLAYTIETDTLYRTRRNGQVRASEERIKVLNELIKVEAFADAGAGLAASDILATASPKLIPAAIHTPNGLNGANEEFYAVIAIVRNFLTNNPTYSDSSFYIGMAYRSIVETAYFNNGGTQIDPNRAITVDTTYNIAVQRVDMVSLDDLGVIDSLFSAYYCSYEPAFAVQTIPTYEAGFSNLSITSIGPNPRTQNLISDVLDIQNDSFFRDSLDRSYIIKYKYTKFYGCDASENADTFTVLAPVQPFFTGGNSQNQYCINDAEFFLNASPQPQTGSGGTFIGTGMGVDNTNTPTVNRMFAPAVAGTGVHTITYLYRDLYGCESSVSRQLEVFPKPVVDLTADQSDLIYCASDTAAYMIGTPNATSGGVGSYAGPTIIGDNVFHPNQAFLVDSSAAAGGVNIIYTYTDTIGCTNSDTALIQVQTLPFPAILNLDTSYCENAGTVNVVGIDQAGQSTLAAAFSGGGIVNNSYTPSLVGVGVDSVKYIHTNIYGCTDSIVQEVRINPVPVPSYTGLNPAYCTSDTATLLVGSPAVPPANSVGASASFNGPGVTFNANTGEFFFSPDAASQLTGTGQSIFVTYTYTNAQGCSGAVVDSTRLFALPQANFDINSSYCFGADLDTLAQNIIGGPFNVTYFQGPGIIDQNLGVLSATTAAQTDTFGLQTITMYFEDANGCGNEISRNYILESLPAVDLIGLDKGYCTNDDLIEFQGFPVGDVATSGQASYITNIPLGAAFNITASADARASIEPSSDSLNTNFPYYVIYQYTGGNQCTNFDTVYVEFFDPPQPTIAQLDSQYCEVQDTILMLGSPLGGAFSGSGTAQGTEFFLPFRAGSGVHDVLYTVQDTNSLSFDSTTLVVCSESAVKTVTVRPLPVPFIASPGDNAAFCESDSAIRVLGQIQNMGSLQDSFYYGTGIQGQFIQILDTVTLANGSTIQVIVPDSIYFFDPGLAGPGTHAITYSASNNFGCVDSVTYNYTVYQLPSPDFIVDSTYCESDGNQLLVGTPVGGVFIQNGDSLASPIYNPNPVYPSQLLTAAVRDTLTYVVSNARCVSSTTKVVEVNPNPVVDFIGQSLLSGDTTYQSCTGTDTIQLYPNISGGEFTGSGVIFQSPYFVSNLAGVGEHLVKYGYTDPLTGCYDDYVDTFMVYSTPNLALSSSGACDDTLTVLKVDNANLGLDGFFQGQGFDSITTIQWDFGDGSIQTGSGPSATTVDSVQHQYLTAGEYDVVLSVENRGFCMDRDTLRVLVSPFVQPTVFAPYYEDFNAGSGNWLEESELGPTSSNLWQWGTATGNVINTLQDTHQNVWTTRLSGAAGSNNGWVYGPCVDLRSLDRPMISLDYINDTDEGNDGTVIEYFNEDLGRWMPLGLANRGINWYYDGIVAGQPGVQVLAPEGWSGSTGGNWTNGRYALDEFAHYDKFRFRIAFGNTGISRTREGFAFDNVWIGNRSRNVLLEHFSNYGMYAGVGFVNQYVYNLVYNTPAVKDVVLVQYNINFPSFDIFNDDNPADPSARTIFYGISEAGKAVVDGQRFGQTAPYSQTLNVFDFEQDMLESPKFTIDPTIQIFNGLVSISTDVIANQDMPLSDYYLQTMILEDSMSYNTGERVHSVLRKALPDAGGTQMSSTFAAGDVFSFSDTWAFDTDAYNSQNLSVVLFVQEDNSFSREVFQVYSSRDISRYVAALGTEEAEAALAEAASLENMKLYPNPAREWVRIEFDGPIKDDYSWKVVDLQGRTLRQGQLQAGEQALELQNLEEFAAGMYLFVVEDPEFMIQRKFVLYRP